MTDEELAQAIGQVVANDAIARKLKDESDARRAVIRAELEARGVSVFAASAGKAEVVARTLYDWSACRLAMTLTDQELDLLAPRKPIGEKLRKFLEILEGTPRHDLLENCATTREEQYLTVRAC